MSDMFEFQLRVGKTATHVAVSLDICDVIGDLLRRTLPGKVAPSVVVISDTTVYGHYGPRVIDSLRSAAFEPHEFLVEPGEPSKCLGVVSEVYDFLAERRISRESTVLALGGGVVSDLAGFAASTWMRGVRFAICPTTMEADLDASLGGKTGVNLAAGKNLVGAFHQPVLVAVDPGCLQTLSPRDVRAGLAESVKHALITSEAFLDWHEVNSDSILSLHPDILAELIHRNLRIKGDFVESDALEQSGHRALLNFGHTIGHAIESSTGFDLRHGECVALGMIAACRLSQQLGTFGADDILRVEKLLTRLNLPTRSPTALNFDEISRRIRLDKKRGADGARFVLLEGIGRPVIRDNVPEEAIREACESLNP